MLCSFKPLMNLFESITDGYGTLILETVICTLPIDRDINMKLQT
jgi:hypothetical protein